MKLMVSPVEVTDPINLGNPTERTIRQLAEQIIDMPNSKSVLENRPLPVDDPQQRRPDISLAASELDWHPKTTLETGLQNTITYFDELLGGKLRD